VVARLRLLSGGMAWVQQQGEHHGNQNEIAVSVQNLYPNYLSAFSRRKSRVWLHPKCC
jgi:hypothetical protein